MRSRRFRFLPITFLLGFAGLGACSGNSSTDSGNPPIDASTDSRAETTTPDSSVADGSANDSEIADGMSADSSPEASSDALVDAQISDVSDANVEKWKGPGPSKLPFPYNRQDEGTPLTATELSAATQSYIDLLKATGYFRVLDERVHGWPKSDPKKQYWYGTWWSGVKIVKQAGKVSFVHSADGADNNGLRTAPLLEASCYARLLWGRASHQDLVHRLVRGFNSWFMAMARKPNDDSPVMLARASYPESVVSEDGGRVFTIDYSLNRPGQDNGATEYVHNPTNPSWGNIWIKNKRSKDDLGQMIRAMAQAEACSGYVDSAVSADMAVMANGYGAWARKVEDESYSIPTWDKKLNYWIPPINETLAHFVTVGNAECNGVLSVRLLGRGDAGSWDCGNGIVLGETLAGGSLNNSAKQILRTFHEGAANEALRKHQDGVGKKLVEGMATRVRDDLSSLESGNPPANVKEGDFTTMLLHAANLGVPLTSREIRWLHKRIEMAKVSYAGAATDPSWHVFATSTPDGSYGLEPGGDGLGFTDLGLPLGLCASDYRNSEARPVLDCAMLIAAEIE